MTDPYDTHADWWHAHRDTSLYERPWLDHLTANLTPGATILDLGCGTGRPIADYLTTSGFTVTGIDRSPAMLAIARRHLPDATFLQANITSLPDLPTFGAIISWDGVFHLSPVQQRTALPRIASRLKPGARLLLTVGPEAGETTGTINGDSVYHASLSAEDYAYILAASGTSILAFVPEDQSAQGRTILLAQKTT